MKSKFDDKAAEEWHHRKTEVMEATLGREHDIVMHAIIPYGLGGGLDLYYFPSGIPGTAVATKELSALPNVGSSNSVYHSYELVMFTRHPLSIKDAKDEETPFGQAHSNINAILNAIAPYSEQAEINPFETCEFPKDMKRIGGKCVVFDGYSDYSDDVARDFGLLAIIEVFRSEIEFARDKGGEKLIAELRQAGHYPYSDMDRDSVV